MSRLFYAVAVVVVVVVVVAVVVVVWVFCVFPCFVKLLKFRSWTACFLYLWSLQHGN